MSRFLLDVALVSVVPFVVAQLLYLPYILNLSIATIVGFVVM